MWLTVAAIVLVYFVAGAIWGNPAVPWVLGGYLLIAVLVVVRQALRLARQEQEAALTFPVQSEPLAGFTPLEVEAIAMIGEASGRRSELIAHLASVEVSLRWNTGSGCLVVLDNTSSAILDDAVLNAVAWFSLAGASAPVGFRIWHTDGVVDLIEAFTDGYETAAIDWRRSAFGAIRTMPNHREPALRPETRAWMKAQIDQAASNGLFTAGEVRLR